MQGRRAAKLSTSQLEVKPRRCRSVVDCLRGEDSNKDRLVPNYVRRLSDDDTAQRQSSVVPKVAESRVEQRNVVRSSRDPANSRRRDGRCLSSREFPVFGTLGRTCHSQFRRFVVRSRVCNSFSMSLTTVGLCVCRGESAKKSNCAMSSSTLGKQASLADCCSLEVCPPAK